MTLWVIATMLFAMFRLMPGDPTTYVVSGQMDPEQQAALIESYGLNEPLHIQYLEFLWSVVTLDFGISFHTRREVSDVIAIYLPNTLVLMITAFVFAYVAGVTLGVIAGWYRGHATEKGLVVLALLQRSFPSFWVGLLALWIFGARLGWIPMAGMGSTGAPSGFIYEVMTVDFFMHVITPAAVLAFYFMGYPMLLMRNNMLEVLGEDFIDVCRAKGLRERTVMFRHAARNALLPVVTAAAIALGYAVGGSVLIETVFGWPGIGREMIRAVLRRDYPVAQGTFVVLAASVIFMNFIADILYSWLDPRVTYD